MKDESVSSPQDMVKKARGQMIRSAIFALAALIVLIFACLAWFMRNTQVNSTLGTIQASGATFELASVGEKSVFTDKIPKELKQHGIEWKKSEKEIGTRTELNETILWQLTDKSNIGNAPSSMGKDTDEKGIVPGSNGQLQFYVIPKTTGQIKVKFHLDIIPLKEDENGNIAQYTEAEKDENFKTLRKLLQGHIMFFYGEDETENSKKWIQSDTEEFTMTFSDENPIPVTLYWEWPYLWENIDGTLRNEIVKNYSSYVFYSGDNTTSSDSTTQTDLYNAADMFIGKNVTWILVRLSAQPV